MISRAILASAAGSIIRRSFVGLALAAVLIGTGKAQAASDSREVLRAKLTAALQDYLKERRKIEMISGLSAFVSLADGETGISAVAGTTRYYDSGERITRRTLYEIGSNTKQMTAALLLQMEAEGLLDIDQTVGDWLPQYPAWGKVTIRRLLNMTSGIPTYTEAPAFMEAQASTPNRHFTDEQKIAYAYPTPTNHLPPSTGWFYSNTNYVLAGLIAEKASGRSLKQLYKTRIFDPLYMRDSYFEPRVLPESVIARMSSGYFNNPVCGTYEPDCKVAPLQPLVGKDMRRADVSWTGAAGGIVSTPRDLQRWVRGLYAGRVLAPKQLKEMLTLVSSDTGKPIKETNADEPHGFGLGVAQVYGPGLGRVWFYEGMTLGYRVVHFYLPKDDIVVTVAANSQAPEGKDELPQLGIDLYEIIKGQETSAEGPKAPEDFD